jgi:DNA topoisomerase I
MVRDGQSLPRGEPASTTQAARLRCVSHGQPGIRRRRAGRGFVYTGPDGTRIDDPEVIGRIRSLAVPPAWNDVWICPHANGHIQATGRDDKGRKQYRYHPRWLAVRDQAKYERALAFGEALPVIRRRTEEEAVMALLRGRLPGAAGERRIA